VAVQGTLWQCKVLYGSATYFMAVQGTLWQCKVLYGSARYFMTVQGTLWQFKVLYGSSRYFMAVQGTLWQCKVLSDIGIRISSTNIWSKVLKKFMPRKFQSIPQVT
jgi:hypothetical protein